MSIPDAFNITAYGNVKDSSFFLCKMETLHLTISQSLNSSSQHHKCVHPLRLHPRLEGPSWGLFRGKSSITEGALDTVHRTEMENSSVSYDYEDYSLGPDLHVDCEPGGSCASVDPLRISPLLLYAAVFLVGVPGNVLVAWVTGATARQSAPSIWFLHLALADLLCCLSLPLMAVPIIRQGDWPFGSAACRLLPSAVLLNMYASVLLLAGASIGRCLAVLRPSRARDRLWPAWAGCGVAWVLALLLTLPSVLTRRLHQEYFPERYECVVDYGGSRGVEGAVAGIRFIGGFLGPLGVVAGCHGVLLVHLRGQPKPHILHLLTLAVVGFFLCWAPYHVVGLVVAAAAPHSELLASTLQAETLVIGLALANSCLNPTLFLVVGRARLQRSLWAACRLALGEDMEEEEEDAGPRRSKSTSEVMVSEMV
ncbi:C5a anaphylatoxin chemotactic receptor 2 isoform X2 [Phascolarctos cinereus]|uniref:C5a anaphylatoxin chemotactic receptor 2 isoform X3 n=1 Tax=Phascolarctos cinereus TaxID=38626 RepID=A0A6P5JIV4_PHACI|nr:C5a anaphylatoxin chemotactic receptor 2 isoform X3 [Phascolarctos cinereus]